MSIHRPPYVARSPHVCVISVTRFSRGETEALAVSHCRLTAFWNGVSWKTLRKGMAVKSQLVSQGNRAGFSTLQVFVFCSVIMAAAAGSADPWPQFEAALRSCPELCEQFMEHVRRGMQSMDSRLSFGCITFPSAICMLLQYAMHQTTKASAFSLLRYILTELKVAPGTQIVAGLQDCTLLMAAVSFGSVRVFTLLLGAGADVNAVVGGKNVVRFLFDGLYGNNNNSAVSREYAAEEKAKLLVQCPQLRPTCAVDWCVSCAEGTPCHTTMQLFSRHAMECARWSPLRCAWIAAVCRAWFSKERCDVCLCKKVHGRLR